MKDIDSKQFKLINNITETMRMTEENGYSIKDLSISFGVVLSCFNTNVCPTYESYIMNVEIILKTIMDLLFINEEIYKETHMKYMEDFKGLRH